MKMNNYHYMILSVLNFNYKGMTFSELEKRLTNKQSKKCCIEKQALTKYINDLVSEGYIEYDANKKHIISNLHHYNVNNKYLYSATLLFVNDIITLTEFSVYIWLSRNIDSNISYESIANKLNINVYDVEEAIRGLQNSGILNVYEEYDKDGHKQKIYKIVA